jgi:hypothetical protein
MLQTRGVFAEPTGRGSYCLQSIASSKMAARVVLQHPKSKHILHKRKCFVTLKKTPATGTGPETGSRFKSKGRRVSRVKKCMRRSLRGIWWKDKITRNFG